MATRKPAASSIPICYAVRMNASERCHEVIDAQSCEVIASFYWNEARYFGQPGIEAQELVNRLHLKALTEQRGAA